jgi:hypothetical protein
MRRPEKFAKTQSSIDAAALNRTAKLFRSFGEDYHERKLEEAYIFPRVRQAGGPAASYVGVILQQHQRGREITAYIIDKTALGKLSTDTAPFASALEAFVLMYENHAAREDTVVSPHGRRLCRATNSTSWARNLRISKSSNLAVTALILQQSKLPILRGGWVSPIYPSLRRRPHRFDRLKCGQRSSVSWYVTLRELTHRKRLGGSTRLNLSADVGG